MRATLDLRAALFHLLMVFILGLLTTPPAQAQTCRTNTDCDDGVFCNGAEACGSGRCQTGLFVDCDDRKACTLDSCAEGARTCTHTAPDADGDGHGASTCLSEARVPLGDDCDDADPHRFPGNTEVCDPGHDEDCNPDTLGGLDADRDGFVSAACGN